MLTALLLLTGVSIGPASAQFDGVGPQPGCRYFERTGHNLCYPFRTFWADNGGSEGFGYPISETFQDSGQGSVRQYFERVRIEHHAQADGTEYEYQLGLLGVELLQNQGRDWPSLEPGDPSADHYFPTTHHAIAPQFWRYWQGHGLEFGDPGVSRRESIARFGYPISEPAMEVNSSGDMVLAQWFERARFELHPDGAPGNRVLLGRLGSELVNGWLSPESKSPGEVVASGINRPRGLTVAPDGTLYVASSGPLGGTCMMAPWPDDDPGIRTCLGFTSSLVSITDRAQQTVVSELPSIALEDEVRGLQDVVRAADGELYGIIGYGGLPDSRDGYGEVGASLGHIVHLQLDGQWTATVDVTAYEAAANPDGGDLDSNPYSLVATGDGGFVVSDAGANALLRVAADGTISTLASFEPRSVDAPGSTQERVSMESVPTGVVEGPDGSYYVGELTGYPYALGSARVWRVTPDGVATVYASGFSNIVDVAFDPEGNLYVLEFSVNNLTELNPDDPETLTGALIRVAPSGQRTKIAGDGLVAPIGLDISDEGVASVAFRAWGAGAGQVLQIDLE